MTTLWNPTPAQLSVRDAAYHTVHDFPGGAGALSLRLGMNSSVLCHKVTPNYEARNHLSIEDACKLMTITNDFRVLHAMAREVNHVAISQEALPSNGVSMDMVGTVKEFSTFLGAVTDSIEDGRITDNEMRDIDAHLGSLVNQANALRRALLATNEQVKANLKRV
jgi:hypothetical protein